MNNLKHFLDIRYQFRIANFLHFQTIFCFNSLFFTKFSENFSFPLKIWHEFSFFLEFSVEFHSFWNFCMNFHSFKNFLEIFIPAWILSLNFIFGMDFQRGVRAFPKSRTPWHFNRCLVIKMIHVGISSFDSNKW